MKSSWQKKIFLQLTVVATFLASAFLATPVSAQTGNVCCIIKKQQTVYTCNTSQHTFSVKNPSTDVTDLGSACTLVDASHPCTVGTTRTNITYSNLSGGGFLCSPDPSLSQWAGNTYDNESVTEQTIQQVVCTSQQLCVQQLNQLTDCSQLKGALSCQSNPNCFFYSSTNECFNRSDSGVCDRITDQAYCGTVDKPSTQGSLVCAWDTTSGRCTSRVESTFASRYARTNGWLPACAYAGNCRSVNDLVEVGLDLVKLGFSLIGSIAFLMFVYGGFTIILSFGNSEKVKHGQQILVAAVIGIIISLSAYLLVQFLVGALGAAAGSAIQ